MKYSSGYYLDVAKSSMSKAGVGELTLSCLKCILGPTSFQGIQSIDSIQCMSSVCIYIYTYVSIMYIVKLCYMLMYKIVDENIPNIT